MSKESALCVSKESELVKLRDWLKIKYNISLADFDNFLRDKLTTNLKDFLKQNWQWGGLGIVAYILTNEVEDELRASLHNKLMMNIVME